MSATAADRTVCGTIKFKDIRTPCGAACGSAAGTLDKCMGPSSDHYVGKIAIQLWDYDAYGEDEYIGTWYVPARSSFCITFPWEGEDYALEEDNPDLYFKYTGWKWGYYGKIYVRDHSNFDVTPAEISWVDSRHDECTAGSSCWMPSTLFISTDPASIQTYMFNVGDSGVHAMYVFGNNTDAGAMTTKYLRYSSVAGTSMTWGCDQARININAATSPWTPAHELGHCYQNQLFDCNGFGTWNYCGYGDVNCGHSLTSQEYDKPGTFEGWANYVAARAWWDPENDSSQPCVYWQNIESPTPVHLDTRDHNRGIELLVARGFWDLDDTHQDIGLDPCGLHTDYTDYDSQDLIAYGWTLFDPGTSNRQAQEGDVDGANLWDYWANLNSAGIWPNSTQAWHSLLSMQCQYGMDWN